MINFYKININRHDFYIINDETMLQLKEELKYNTKLQVFVSSEGSQSLGIEFLTKVFYKNFEDWEIIKDRDCVAFLVSTNCKSFIKNKFNVQVNELIFDIRQNNFSYNKSSNTNNFDKVFKLLNNNCYLYNYYNNEILNLDKCKNKTLKATYEYFLGLTELNSNSKEEKSKIEKFEKVRYPLKITFPDYMEYIKIKNKVEEEKLDVGKTLGSAKESLREYNKIQEGKNKLNFVESFYNINFEKLEINNKNTNIELYIETKDEYLINVINSYKIESPIEQILYQKIYKIGLFKVIPQYNIDCYIVDFLIKDEEDNDILVIECDGFEYHNKFYMQRDYERQRYLQLKGYLFMRFTGSEIYNDVDECAKEIILYYQLLQNKLK